MRVTYSGAQDERPSFDLIARGTELAYNFYFMSVNVGKEIKVSGGKGIPNSSAVKLQVFLIEIHGLNLNRDITELLFIKDWHR